MQEPISPITGGPLSQALYCCLCFKALRPDQCNVLASGAKEDVCVPCAEEEKKANRHHINTIMSKTIQCIEIVPGVLIQEGVSFSKGAAESYLLPLVGKRIANVQVQECPSGSSEPEIVLNFDDGSAAVILADAEGNGPGFIEFVTA